MSIMDLKKNAPKGEFLAYINKEEAAMLKKAGGSGKLVNGIPSFRPQDMGNKENQAVSANNPGIGGLGAGRTDGGDHTGDYSSKTAATEKAKYEKQFGGVSPTGSRPRSFFDRINKYNSDYQQKARVKLAQKRAFQKYRDIEKYADIMDDYGLSAEDLAKEVAANPSYGYDFSDLDLGKKTLGSNIGTSIEKYRTNLYDVSPKTKYSITQAILDKTRPDTQVTAMNTLNKARDYRDLAVDPNISREKLEALANRGKTPEQINPPSGGDNNQPFIPINYNTGAAEGPDYDGTNQFTYDENAFGPGGDSADVTRASYIFNKGGRVPAMEGGIMGTRARRAMGGIMNRVDQRQGYFLGGIGKAIKGAVSGVVDATKKVLKSDLGKAALLAAGTYYAGGGFGRLSGGFKFGNIPGASMFAKDGIIRNAAGSMFSKLPENATLGQKFGKAAMFGVAGLGLSMIPGLNKPKPNETSYADRGGHLIDPLTGQESIDGGPSMRKNIELAKIEAAGDPDKLAAIDLAYNNMLNLPSSRNRIPYEDYKNAAEGGRMRRAEGGLMDLGGMEKDYRAEGGFVPIGEYEKKDDVPARLSVNEFVFTADAVRGAGQGDIDKGAEIMENMMENLENGGTVSEESQGNKGAQQMFETSQRLGEVV